MFRHPHLHVVAGGLTARGPGDRLAQLLLDVPGIGPPVGILERLAQDIVRLQTRRCQRRPVGLDQNALRCHQSHEHGRAKSIDQIAQARFAPMRRHFAGAQPFLRVTQLELRRAQGSDQLGRRSLDVQRRFAGVVVHSPRKRGRTPFSQATSRKRGTTPFRMGASSIR